MFANGRAFVGYVDGTGSVGNDRVDVAVGVRPVISLKNGVLVNSNGDGTRTNPYVVI